MFYYRRRSSGLNFQTKFCLKLFLFIFSLKNTQKCVSDRMSKKSVNSIISDSGSSTTILQNSSATTICTTLESASTNGDATPRPVPTTASKMVVDGENRENQKSNSKSSVGRRVGHDGNRCVSGSRQLSGDGRQLSATPFHDALPMFSVGASMFSVVTPETSPTVDPQQQQQPQHMLIVDKNAAAKKTINYLEVCFLVIFSKIICFLIDWRRSDRSTQIIYAILA